MLGGAGSNAYYFLIFAAIMPIGLFRKNFTRATPSFRAPLRQQQREHRTGSCRGHAAGRRLPSTDDNDMTDDLRRI